MGHPQMESRTILFPVFPGNTRVLSASRQKDRKKRNKEKHYVIKSHMIREQEIEVKVQSFISPIRPYVHINPSRKTELFKH